MTMHLDPISKLKWRKLLRQETLRVIYRGKATKTSIIMDLIVSLDTGQSYIQLTGWEVSEQERGAKRYKVYFPRGRDDMIELITDNWTGFYK